MERFLPRLNHCIGGLPVKTLRSDLAYALRLLCKSPRFTIAVVLTLAIGIASNTIIFSIARSVFLRQMAYPDAGRLVYVSQVYPGYPVAADSFLIPRFETSFRRTSPSTRSPPIR